MLISYHKTTPFVVFTIPILNHDFIFRHLLGFRRGTNVRILDGLARMLQLHIINSVEAIDVPRDV